MLNLDTHILLHAVTGGLRAPERRLLAAKRWSISAIVLWEVAKLAHGQLDRITMDLQDPEIVRVLARVACVAADPRDRPRVDSPRCARRRPGRRADRRDQRGPRHPAGDPGCGAATVQGGAARALSANTRPVNGGAALRRYLVSFLRAGNQHDRTASAMIVRVGFWQALDTKLAPSMTNTLPTSWACWNRLSTDVRGSVPMRATPSSWIP